ncbi:MAG: STAS domain-containing protein [Thioalkalispiraceae bacterium]|jgi:anti-anti-sigma regulatory factor
MTNTVNVVCEESVDISLVSELHNQIASQIEEGCTVSLDAGQVERIDTAGLQLFAALFSDAQVNNFTVNWVNPSEVVKTSARLVGLDKHLQLASD